MENEKEKMIVNGNSMTMEEFVEMQKDCSIKLKLIEGTNNEYKILTKMFG